jgi:hypothetical protein
MSNSHGVPRIEMIEALGMEERRRVALEEQGAPIRERVEQAAVVAQLTSALRRMQPEVSAYAVVDDDGTIWSGHTSPDEALHGVALWGEWFKNGRGLRVEYRSVLIGKMRRDDWEGPEA